MPTNSLGIGSMLEPIPNISNPNFSNIAAELLRVDPSVMQQVAGYTPPPPSAQAAPIPTTSVGLPQDPIGRDRGRGRGRSGREIDPSTFTSREEWLRNRGGGTPSPTPGTPEPEGPSLANLSREEWLRARMAGRG